MSEKTKKGFKMPSSFSVLLIIIAIMAVLTWIIPAGQYKVDDAGAIIAGSYESVKAHPQGIWDVLMAPINAMLGKAPTSAAIDVAFFILMVGGFLGVVNETGTLDVGIASIVRKYKGREKMLILILMPLFALGGTTYGMGEETMAFYIRIGVDAGLSEKEAQDLANRFGSNTSRVLTYAVDGPAPGLRLKETMSLRYSLNEEMTLTPVDYLLRRTNALLFHAETLAELKQPVVDEMAQTLGWDDSVKAQQLAALNAAIADSQLAYLKTAPAPVHPE